IFHSTLPVRSSSARNQRSREPSNTTPPAVASTALLCGARSRRTHSVLRVARSTACTRPTIPSPSSFGFAKTAMSMLFPSLGEYMYGMQVSLLGMNSTPVLALKEVAGQLRPPPEADGQTVLITSALGSSSSEIVLAPVLGSMPTTRF